ncbi:MAG: response regulator transcription factor [Vicinamibacterales bacterium]
MTNKSQPRIRVLCVDDHPVVREGLTRRIAIERDMTVVGTAATGEEALRVFEAHQPDVTLMDLNLPGMGGLETIVALQRRHPLARIIVLTMYDGDEDIHRALLAGAAAYVLKTTVSDELIDVIRQVHEGARPMSSDVAAQLSARSIAPKVTPREKQVLQLMAGGLRNKEIAAALGIAEDTVEVHAKKIFTKLTVRDRTAAVTVALKRGIIHLK